MSNDFVVPKKCTIFWPNKVWRVYFDLNVPDFPKRTYKYVLFSVLRQKSKNFKVLFSQIWHIQIKIYHQTYIEPKYGAFYSNNEFTAITLSVALFVQKGAKVEKVLFQKSEAIKSK